MRFVIVGNGAAGVAAAEQARLRDPLADITIITEDGRLAYSRPRITEILSGKWQQPLVYRREPFYLHNKLDVHSGVKVTMLDPLVKSLYCLGGQQITYDRLLLTTGSRAVLPSIAGAEMLGVFTLRTVRDAIGIFRAHPRNVVVYGGGLVALKAAHALLESGSCNVTLVVTSKHVMTRQLDDVAASLVAGEFESLGAKFVYNQEITALTGRGRVDGVVLSDGGELPADVVLIGKGVVPETDFFAAAGGAIRTGIVIDEYCKTNLTDVWAAGDCVELLDSVDGGTAPSAVWPLAVEVGKAAGANMAGGSIRMGSRLLRMNAGRFGRMSFVVAGSLLGERTVIRDRNNCYQRLTFRGNRLVGYLTVGMLARAGLFRALIENPGFGALPGFWPPADSGVNAISTGNRKETGV